MKSASLRTAVLALLEFSHPSVTDADTLHSYAQALDDMADVAEAAGKMVTGDRYRVKATVLRRRALGV